MKIIIHGGFFSESHTNQEVKLAKQEALNGIVQLGYKHLQHHTAAETAVYTVRLLEDCELFNAGTGSQIQSDGKIRLSASLMDGKTQRFSGVINIEDVKNPICVAEKLRAYDDRVLSGKGACDFVIENGHKYYNPEIPQRRHEYEQKLSDSIRLGTVGCVALDVHGNLAAATSTGGKGFEIPGRTEGQSAANALDNSLRREAPRFDGVVAALSPHAAACGVAIGRVVEAECAAAHRQPVQRA